jgi:CubicO group peptidase (beta-lactamase class C family)
MSGRRRAVGTAKWMGTISVLVLTVALLVPASSSSAGVTASAASRGKDNATGVADLTNGMPLAPDMQFKIASQTKAFTADLILQLVGEGKYRLYRAA